MNIIAVLAAVVFAVLIIGVCEEYNIRDKTGFRYIKELPPTKVLVFWWVIGFVFFILGISANLYVSGYFNHATR